MSTMRRMMLKVPAGTSHVQMITGRSVMVRGDRTIEVSEEEVRPLCAIGYLRL
jgi:hypothetical protein